jgi:aryl-alcohol dehydrogenase-like predicted oxidoreductase
VIKYKFGWTNVDVSVIGQGTWMMVEGDNDLQKYESAIKSLKLGLDLGMTHLDTTEMYGNGLVEQLVGQAIIGRREEVFLVSKLLPLMLHMMVR